ncbi:hypothetical protein [Paenibacillus sp. Soil522]|uniref:hypothetical protein n=1 Tax=Paenibacillus sp. Soil522 TaxID=1736388 RepID=UPI0006F9A317|nr:hypothetical protein [Paenibacillus sp. Soil522]KRE45517.1 hypothetical protein ASG81_12960 [Paenibacillus sp. Soil522]
MNRNAIESIRNIFDLLYEQIGEEERVRVINRERRLSPHPKYPRENIDAFIRCKITNVIYLQSTTIVGINYHNNSFVLIAGHNVPDTSFAKGIGRKITSIDEEIVEGLSLAVVSERYLKIKRLEGVDFQLIDQIFGLNDGRYSFEQIKYFIEEYEIWEVDPDIYDIENKDHLIRIYACLVIDGKINNLKSDIVLGLSDSCLMEVKKLIENINSVFIVEVLLRALTSNHWEHSFLEFYRCLEKVFTVYYIDLLKNGLGVDTPKIEQGLNQIGFRYAESTIINKLFQLIETNFPAVESIIGTLGVLDEQMEVEQVKENAAKKYYELRCRIAHLKYRHNHVNLTDVQWNTIIENSCLIIGEIYDRFSSCLNDLVDVS